MLALFPWMVGAPSYGEVWIRPCSCPLGKKLKKIGSCLLGGPLSGNPRFATAHLSKLDSVCFRIDGWQKYKPNVKRLKKYSNFELLHQSPKNSCDSELSQSVWNDMEDLF